jgi:2-(1,2-epoxy-1,2-dihydrophenyl)acetyl-CoA isomerase
MTNVRIDTRNGVASLTLNRPERLNGFTDSLALELCDAICDASASDDVRVLTIGGSGQAFSAGMDLSNLLRNGMEAVDIGRTLRRFYNPIALALTEADCTTICRLHGVAAGGAASLALSCDFMVVTKDARLVSAFSRIGLVPDCGGTWAMVHKLGLVRAQRFAMLEEQIDAAELKTIGLAIEVTEDRTELDAACARLADRLITASPVAVASTRRALAAAAHSSLATQLEHETQTQIHAVQSADFAEGVTAFFEKRKPSFE